MSICVRRALRHYRHLSLLLRTTSLFLPSRQVSYLATSSTYLRRIEPSPAFNFLQENRRGYAKGRRQTKFDDDDGDDYEEEENGKEDEKSAMQIVNIGPTVKAAAVSQMESAIDSLSRELLKLRTGRASAGMLDHIIVETGGVKISLNRMAVVTGSEMF